MRISFTFLILICMHPIFAQPVATVEVESNNLKWFQYSNGIMFNNGGSPGLEAPAGSDIYAIYSHGLWVSGVTSEGVIHVAAQKYCQDSPYCEYGTGPLPVDGSMGTSAEVETEFNRFWIVNQSDVDDHVSYFECLDDAGCDVNVLFPYGYIIPEDFLSWPAQGDVENGYAENLAPFVDWNDNGTYDPENGDYPLVCGNVTTYIINNDVSAEHTDSQGLPLGLEVHTTLYTFDAEEEYLFNTIFVQHKIINRSNETYEDTYVGTFTDFDLGNPNDDFVGTDVERSMVYVYNGNEIDGPSSSGPGYGDDLGVLGLKFFDGPFKDANGQDDEPLAQEYDTYGNQASGWGDGISDNERWGLAYSLAFNNFGSGPPATTDPSAPIEFYNYMRGIWKDGTPLTHGANGYNPGSSALSARYIFPGTSDPIHYGTDYMEPSDEDWTESSAGNNPGDRRMIGSSGPFTFEPGDVQYFDYAVIFARDSQEPGVDPLETLRTYADQVVGMHCGILPDILVSNRDINPDEIALNLYPNPANDRFVIETGTILQGRYIVTDITGRTIVQGMVNGNRTEIQTSGLPTGIYLVRMEAEGKVGVKKIVVKR